MKYKIATFIEKNLVDELNRQDKLGYEMVQILNTYEPSAYVTDRSYRILLKSTKK